MLSLQLYLLLQRLSFYLSEKVICVFLCLCTQDRHAYSNLILNTINKLSKLSLHHLFNMAFLELPKFNIPPRGLVNGLPGHTNYLICCLYLSLLLDLYSFKDSTMSFFPKPSPV